MSDKPKVVILIKERALESWVRDASTFALFASLIGLGWFLDSQAMQWVGAVMGFITVISQSKRGEWTCTIPEARARLDVLEKEA